MNVVFDYEKKLFFFIIEISKMNDNLGLRNLKKFFNLFL